jgi:hypothetical protein
MFPMSNPYGQPYAAGGVPQPHPQGTTVLVLGIVGLVVCPIAGVVAIVLSKKALQEVDANPYAYNNRQSLSIGRILGIVAVVLWLLLIAFYIVIFVILGASGALSP